MGRRLWRSRKIRTISMGQVIMEERDRTAVASVIKIGTQGDGGKTGRVRYYKKTRQVECKVGFARRWLNCGALGQSWRLPTGWKHSSIGAV
jgi:hypothetical protein